MGERPNALVVYGPLSHALSDYLSSVPRHAPMVRIHGATTPEARPGCRDVARMSDLPEAMSWLVGSTSRPLRIGVLGAAVAPQSSLLASETDSSIDRQLETNVANYVSLVRACLPAMISNRYGRFVYLSSFRANTPTRGTTVYSASKAFGEAFFSGVGVEYGRLGITATSIRMGYFEGGLLSEFDDERLRAITRHVSLARLGRPSDLSDAIDFAFSSDLANGGVLELEGGLDHA